MMKQRSAVAKTPASAAAALLLEAGANNDADDLSETSSVLGAGGGGGGGAGSGAANIISNQSQRPAAVGGDSFVEINERPVDDISLNFFYKPHTVTLLAIAAIAVMYCAFVRDETNIQENIWAGMLCVIFFFVIVSVLAFPNGPFTRPHPAVWRILFGVSVLYLMLLVFLMFQNYNSIMDILYWFYPDLRDFHIDQEREYAVNCSDVSPEKIWQQLDIYAAAHFLGWMFKAILVRHMGILWAISVMWEITEMAFAHLLPNFKECWWDALVLDVLVCNGLGIWCGLRLCKLLEMREYRWASIRDISSTSGKIKRAVLQFTPGSWTAVRWLDPKSTYMRTWGVCQLVIFWQVTELNTFFLKHIFEMPPSHPLVAVRLVLIGLFVAPSVRQYYVYITDTRCKRVGTQCWVYGAIMVCEAILCIKNARDLFGRTQATNIIVWLGIQMLLSIMFLYGCMLWHRYFQDAETAYENSPMKPSAAANRVEPHDLINAVGDGIESPKSSRTATATSTSNAANNDDGASLKKFD